MFEVVENNQRTRSARCSDRERRKATRIHVFVENETILENLTNRRNRPRDLYREIVLDQYPDLKGRIRWSQKAGCGCGCSPGFIVDDTLRTSDHVPFDVYITVKISDS